MIDATFAALADPTRRSVVERLSHGPCRATDLATALTTSAPAMSRHLKVLRQAGLVEPDAVEDDARVRLYRLRAGALSDLEAWLAEVKAFWTAELGAFAEHVAQTRGPR